MAGLTLKDFPWTPLEGSTRFTCRIQENNSLTHMIIINYNIFKMQDLKKLFPFFRTSISISLLRFSGEVNLWGKYP
jgi:hypothetical protein